MKGVIEGFDNVKDFIQNVITYIKPGERPGELLVGGEIGSITYQNITRYEAAKDYLEAFFKSLIEKTASTYCITKEEAQTCLKKHYESMDEKAMKSLSVTNGEFAYEWKVDGEIGRIVCWCRTRKEAARDYLNRYYRFLLEEKIGSA